MKLDENVTRLISAKASQVSKYTGRQLREAINKFSFEITLFTVAGIKCR